MSDRQTSNGYLAINEGEDSGYMVSDAEGIARLVGVHRNTISNWFKRRTLISFEHNGKKWIITHGYEIIKSNRGGFGK
jgi:hypothetical protein